MIRQCVRSTFPVGPSRSLAVPAYTRGIYSGLPALRQQERLPRGHVRPRRLPTRSRPSTYPASTQLGDQPLDHDTYVPDSLPIHPSGPVNIPPDPQGVLGDSHTAREILGHDTLVIVRQLEMLNVFMGFEQANRYAIHSPDGQLVGFLAEEEQGILSTISRQALRTHRPFRSVIMDRNGNPILWIKRPFAFINSKIFVQSSEGPDSRLVGEAQQQWHPWRRRYNLFQIRESETFRQFAKVDSGFLAWDFWLKDKDDRLLASINRNFKGFGRELFTDTGQYVIRFDAAGTELDVNPGSNVQVQGQTLIMPQKSEGGLTLDQRAMTLATAVSIDFDYFSRHSGSGGMGFPLFWWGGSDGADAQAGSRPADVQPSDGAMGGVTAGAAGAAGASMGRDMTEDELIYGRQPSDAQQYPESSEPYAQDAEGEQGYQDDEDPGWSEEVMQDPWGSSGDDSGGWFGGGDGGDGGW